jgi:hypothetical protein
MDLSKINRKDIEGLPEMDKIKDFLEENGIKINWKSNFKQVLYHYLNGIKSVPICRCGNLINFRSFNSGYRKNCSPKCAANSEETKLLLKISKIEKYGDPNYNNSKKMMETKKRKYGDSNYNNRLKAIETNIEKYGFTSPMKNKHVIEKSKTTKFEKYGDSTYNNPSKIKEFWENVGDEYKLDLVNKVKKSKLENHGNSSYNNPNKMIETKVLKGILRDEKSDMKFKDYKNRVRSRTNTKRSQIFSEWDGYDFYTGIYIKENLSLSHTNGLYPTIDHKIPIVVAYRIGLSVEETASIENICVTTRENNSIKRDMMFEDFIKLINR